MGSQSPWSWGKKDWDKEYAPETSNISLSIEPICSRSRCLRTWRNTRCLAAWGQCLHASFGARLLLNPSSSCFDSACSSSWRTQLSCKQCLSQRYGTQWWISSYHREFLSLLQLILVFTTLKRSIKIGLFHARFQLASCKLHVTYYWHFVFHDHVWWGCLISLLLILRISAILLP